MLKIKLHNLNEATPLIDLLRQLIHADLSFASGTVESGSDTVESELQNDSELQRYYIEGVDITGETYQGLILSPSIDAIDKRGAVNFADSAVFLEKPFVFSSIADATQIWPHQTLEDRVIDCALFALSGYITPKTAKLVD